MPYKAQRPCKHHGCPNLMHERYCELHAGETHISDRYRPTAAKRGYGHKWRIESKKFLLEHPYCECDACRILGRKLKSEVVDHVVLHRGDPKLFWDRSNWQAMVRSCHIRKTVKENGGFGNKRAALGDNPELLCSHWISGRRTACDGQ